MASFNPTDLFGGAISCDMPEGYIDSSTLRQIPDNQEVYLSPTTLTSIIIEINERVDDGNDESAAKYHLRDICDANEDTFDDSLFSLQRITLGKINGSPTYQSRIRITPSNLPLPSTISGPNAALASNSSSSPTSELLSELEKKTTTCHHLLIRLQEKSTDILVLVNVPHSELISNSIAAVEQENNLAAEILGKIVQTFEIKDMSLFEAE